MLVWVQELLGYQSSEISYIEEANNSSIEKYWFELTESGRLEQDRIIID